MRARSVAIIGALTGNALPPHTEGAAAKLAFLGRMLGKLLLEGIIVELPLAGFFLNALLRRPNTRA